MTRFQPLPQAAPRACARARVSTLRFASSGPSVHRAYAPLPTSRSVGPTTERTPPDDSCRDGGSGRQVVKAAKGEVMPTGFVKLNCNFLESDNTYICFRVDPVPHFEKYSQMGAQLAHQAAAEAAAAAAAAPPVIPVFTAVTSLSAVPHGTMVRVAAFVFACTVVLAHPSLSHRGTLPGPRSRRQKWVVVSCGFAFWPEAHLRLSLQPWTRPSGTCPS